MKKIKFVAPVLLASTMLLCACRSGTPAIGLSANWNKDTTISTIDVATDTVLETLTYDVTFEGPETTGYAVHYGNGTYTTSLRSYRFVDMEPSQYGYYYRTELNIPVWFTIGEQTSETFNDTIVSEVWFLDLEHALQPVKSTKTSTSHTPVNSSPKSFDDTYYVHYYDYKSEIAYNNPLSEAAINVSYSQLTSVQEAAAQEPYKAEDSITTSVKSTNFFDNEQLLFVLRGYGMGASAKLNTLNPTSYKSQSTVNLTAPSAVTRYRNFTITEGGNVQQPDENKELTAFETTIAYSSGMSGQAQKLVYAATTDTKLNEYRNVLLYQEVPLFSSLGTLKYTLKTATFY